MKALALLTLAVGAHAEPAYHYDLSRLFPTEVVEQSDRDAVLRAADAFAAAGADSVNSSRALADWLARYDALGRRLQRHEIYAYLRAESDRDDRAYSTADETLSSAIDRLDGAARATLAKIGSATIARYRAQDAVLARYGYFLDTALRRADHADRSSEAIARLATPSLDSLARSYSTLRSRITAPAAQDPAVQRSAQQLFEASWTPFIEHEEEFAALLVPIVTLQNGAAELQGFANAPEAKCFYGDLSPGELSGVLNELRGSESNRRYAAVIAAAVGQRLNLTSGQVHVWDLGAVDTYEPAAVAFSDALPLIVAATQTLGPEYAAQYARLFDPAAGRVEWCRTERCDDSGFSVGYAGIPSGLFYGAFRGTTNNVRAVAHEAGHAVHRQFMSESQAFGPYNEGPHFMFESFAIFNEFLLWRQLYGKASTPAARAYYLRQFLEDATHQLFGSAAEVDLEQSIYAGVKSGALRSAADLDALTLEVLARYQSASALAPSMKVSWARNRLYFTDPLYDANYLLAGVLALDYLAQLEADPKTFEPRYVALLKNGFTDPPQILLKRFLGMNLEDSASLVREATAVIDRRTDILKVIYNR
jgi:oligoendopeptidase F